MDKKANATQSLLKNSLFRPGFVSQHTEAQDAFSLQKTQVNHTTISHSCNSLHLAKTLAGHLNSISCGQLSRSLEILQKCAASPVLSGRQCARPGLRYKIQHERILFKMTARLVARRRVPSAAMPPALSTAK